ncbi:Uncharacterised protein [Achromobacter xylosoxidans]|nr:Uncharacterised protein [Achromobacter xylosoxidans]
MARVGDTDFCAQFIVSWITALARPSPIAPPAHSHENSGTASPSAGISANDTSPAVSSCTAVTRRLSTELAKWPIRMISAAIAAAPASVASSPALKCSAPASGPASSTSPVNASATPTQLISPGGRLSTAHCSSGTIGTYSAVMKADWLLVMVRRPSVCR